MSNSIHKLIIGDKTARYPVIQGGMGVGVSGASLAGAVALAGGVGIISTAQLGYTEPDFNNNPFESTIRAIEKSIKKAKEIAANSEGLVGVNVMVALKHYKEHVKAAVKAGADVIISGAGLPLELPELVNVESGTKIAPIVSSARACKLILKQWKNKYKRTADFLVYEGPRAGGHLGFHLYELKEMGFVNDENNSNIDYDDKKNSSKEKSDVINDSSYLTIERIKCDEEIKKIIEVKAEYEKEYGINIPLIVAGGIYDSRDVKHVYELGANGVQLASRFVATYECDASDAYKQAYINAKDEDVCIIKSPVGMPGRALNNAFVKKTREGNIKINKCYQCLARCNPAEVPYCITKALIDAVKGDVDNGLVFCGANVGRINKMMSVKEVIDELMEA